MTVEFKRNESGAIEIIEDGVSRFIVNPENVKINKASSDTKVNIDIANGKESYRYLYTDIAEINDVAPTSIEDAVLRLATEIFSVAPAP